MADTIYTVNQDSPESIPGFEKYSQNDKSLLTSFEVNNVFDPTKHFAELHILTLVDELVESDYNYSKYTQLGNAQSAGRSGATTLTIDPIEDTKSYGYDLGGVKLLYHFLSDLYTPDSTTTDFFIESISEDRTELRLQSLTLSSTAISNFTSDIKTKLQNTSYFSDFRLDFGNNDLLIGVNIDTVPSTTGTLVVVKLYEPLLPIYGLKSTLKVVEVIADSVAYEVDATITQDTTQQPTLRPANFNLEITDEHVISTQYFNYDELFSYPINNTNSQVYSLFNEKGVELSIDHSDFSNFVHFSSAQERLINFKYKLDLITTYSGSLASIAANTISGSLGVSGSRTYYENLITGIVNNFDHYERFLYYESGSASWPKSNTTKPYINKPSSAAESITWYANEATTALKYDQTNYNSLVYSIPTFIRDDANNDNYSTFIYMVGQHFDNLWLYSKAVTDKYDADNRIDHGISKDLVAEALKNFGVKLYTSDKSIEDLFTTYVGQSYQSGSELIRNYITGSLTGSNTPIQPTSYDDYQKEVQKRLYHNLPFLLKSKGTEKGLRALINCFGIPSDILKIKLYGGRNVNERPFFGDYQYYTSSLDKIRLDHTGSLVTGSTLSGNTSIVKRDPKYTDDLHNIEVGFSPTDSIDAYIVSRSAATFNIDDYIGDPRDLTSGSYTGLYDIAQTVTSGSVVSGSYDLQDYVRLIKFFDNTIFKTIKDFIPARVVADTGIIIKPNLLNRSKAKSVAVSVTQPEYSGSIDTAFISGSHGNSFGRDDSYRTSWTEVEQTPLGLASNLYHSHEEPKFDGEFSGSVIRVSNGELNEANIYKELLYNVSDYNIQLWNNSDTVCVLNFANPTTRYVFANRPPYNITDFFTGTPTTTQYFITDATATTQVNFPYTFSGYTQYEQLTLTANNIAITEPEPCIRKVKLVYGICELSAIQQAFWVAQGTQTNLYNFFSGDGDDGVHPNRNLQFTVNGNSIGTQNVYVFDPSDGAVQTVTVSDTLLGGLCTASVTVNVNTTQTYQGGRFRYYKYEGTQVQDGTVSYSTTLTWIGPNGPEVGIVKGPGNDPETGEDILPVPISFIADAPPTRVSGVYQFEDVTPATMLVTQVTVRNTTAFPAELVFEGIEDGTNDPLTLANVFTNLTNTVQGAPNGDIVYNNNSWNTVVKTDTFFFSPPTDANNTGITLTAQYLGT